MKSSIKWFADNPVAANLFMFTVFVLGFITLPDIRKELIPNVSLERIGIQTTLAGASVETIEASVCKPIENQIYDIEGTLELTSFAYEGLCSMTLDVADGYSTKEVLDEVQSRLESYDLLPSDAEDPVIKELIVRNRVSKLILSGTADYPSMVRMARTIREELLESENISVIDLEDVKDSEIQIYIPEHNLEQYNVSFAEISGLIRQQSNQLPGGMLKTNDGDVLITTDGKKDTADGYRNIVIASNSDGAEIRLGDIATIYDNRSKNLSQAKFDRRAAVSMDIYRVGEQNIMSIAEAINGYISQKSLPENMALYVWQDESKNFKSRIDLLLENAFSGLFLLFLILVLFLNLRLSLWVTLGIPFSFFASLMLMPTFDVSINIVSLFAFILVLGVVVDDAVIVGESVHKHNQLGKYGTEGALAGVYEVYKPILFAVCTTIVAFLPLLFLPGPEGKLMQAIPIIVICILIFSLLESIYILPAHLSGKTPDSESGKSSIMKHYLVEKLVDWTETQWSKHFEAKYGRVKIKTLFELTWLTRLQNRFSHWMDHFSQHIYQPVLIKALKNKGLVIISFCLAFVLFIVLLSTGWMKISLGIAIDAEVVTASVTFPEGSPRKNTESAVNKMLDAADELSQELQIKVVASDDDIQIIQHVYSVIGPKIKISNQDNKPNRDHTAHVTLELSGSQDRPVSGQYVLNRWRELIGDIDGATQLTFSASINPAKPDINIEFSSHNQESLETIAKQLRDKLSTYNGVFDISDSLNEKKQQVRIELKDNAVALGLTLEQVTRQVSRAFQGEVVQTLQTSDDEVDVWLGLPDHERASMWYLENFPVLISPGRYVNLSTIADMHYKQAPNNIRRFERQRTVIVSAYVNTEHNSVYNVQKDLKNRFLDDLVAQYSDMSWSAAGKQRSIVTFLDILMNGYLIAIFVMYLMMAILFSSYSQPLLVLFAIPFGILGSLIGHMVLNLAFTLWSFIGMVAVSGIVVNDNLVLMDFINEQRKKGVNIFTAVCEAGKSRFRPILLTSITTFAGLTPLILETSVQAQFLIPMAVSLAFGVVFATLISLLLVPASYLLLDQWITAFTAFGKRSNQVTLDTESVEEAYERGFDQGSRSKKKVDSPYSDEVLSSSWEAGWLDGLSMQTKDLETPS
jgi:multidrug efflux pump subunit AcrB/ribosome modulation factor